MKRTLATIAAVLIAGAAFAAVPLWVDIDVNYQQAQDVPRIQVMQGRDMQMRFRLKSDRSWMTLTGLTGQWEARSSATSTT